MQRTISLNSRELEIITTALLSKHVLPLLTCLLPNGYSTWDADMLEEEVYKLANRLKDGEIVGGVFIDGERV